MSANAAWSLVAAIFVLGIAVVFVLFAVRAIEARVHELERRIFGEDQGE